MRGSVLAQGDILARVTVRPQVPMGAIQAAGFVCAMGVVEALRELGLGFAAIGWPHDVVDARTYRVLCELRLKAGYERGMYVACEVVGGAQVGLLRKASGLGDALATGMERRVEDWADALGGRLGVGPLAPVLPDYFDLVALMGERVEVVYPNGRPFAEGRLAGVNVWGAATVVLDDGQELEVSAEQARIRPAAA